MSIKPLTNMITVEHSNLRWCFSWVFVMYKYKTIS